MSPLRRRLDQRAATRAKAADLSCLQASRTTGLTTDRQLLEILKVTVWQQCVIGRRAATEIRYALRLDDTPPPPVPRDRVMDDLLSGPFGHDIRAGTRTDLVRQPRFDRRTHGVWAGAQLLLGSAANVSKLLWPLRDDRSNADLRRLLDAAGATALKDRSLRNSFEHIDERIVAWSRDNLGTRFTDSIIVKTREELPTPLPLRAFLSNEFSVVFLGDTYELAPIVKALEHVATRADPAGGTHL